MGYPKGRSRSDPQMPGQDGVAVVEIPPAADELDANEKAAWEDLRSLVNPKGITTAADLIAFELTAQSLAISRRAYRELWDKGLIDSGEKMDRPSPAAGIMATHQKLAWHGLAKFGMTPADRLRVKAGGHEGKPEDPEDEFGVGADATGAEGPDIGEPAGEA